VGNSRRDAVAHYHTSIRPFLLSLADSSLIRRDYSLVSHNARRRVTSRRYETALPEASKPVVTYMRLGSDRLVPRGSLARACWVGIDPTMEAFGVKCICDDEILHSREIICEAFANPSTRQTHNRRYRGAKLERLLRTLVCGKRRLAPAVSPLAQAAPSADDAIRLAGDGTWSNTAAPPCGVGPGTHLSADPQSRAQDAMHSRPRPVTAESALVLLRRTLLTL